MKNKLNSRKLITAFLIMVVATVLITQGLIGSAEWVQVITWVFAIYSGGNIGEHIITRRESRL